MHASNTSETDKEQTEKYWFSKKKKRGKKKNQEKNWKYHRLFSNFQDEYSQKILTLFMVQTQTRTSPFASVYENEISTSTTGATPWKMEDQTVPRGIVWSHRQYHYENQRSNAISTLPAGNVFDMAYDSVNPKIPDCPPMTSMGHKQSCIHTFTNSSRV